MKIFNKMRSFFRSLSDPWDNSLHDIWQNMGFRTKSGVNIGEETAIKYITLYSCVTLIAGDMAGLPLILYQKTGENRKKRATDHYLYDILHNDPNDEMTSYNFRETLQGHALLWGNGYAVIERGGRSGAIKSLWPVEYPGSVKVCRDQVTRKIFYEWHSEGKTYRYPKESVLHIPGFSFDGLKGLSNVAIARESIGLGLALEEYGQRYFGQGFNMSGIISINKNLGDNTKMYLKRLKERYAGLEKSHGIMVLQNGETYTRLSLPMQDAQFIESRKFQKTEICGIYHVPPHKIGVHGQNSNYNNLENENQSYIDSCLLHWVRRWEFALNKWLLTPSERKQGLYFEFLLDGLLRGDSKARSEFYRSLWQVGAITPDEIRSRENLNEYDNGIGNEPFIPVNYMPMKQMIESGGNVDNRSNTLIKRYVDIEKRSLNNIAKGRDKIRDKMKPVLRDAIEKVVNRENIALTKELKKQAKNRSKKDIQDFIDDFYAKFNDVINKHINSPFVSYAKLMQDIVSLEIEIDNPEYDEIASDVSEYIDGYVRQYIDSSLGQLNSLLDGENPVEEMQKRVDEWREKRVDKELDETSVGIASMVARAVIIGGGYALVWRNRGDSCPICKQLEGRKVVKKKQPFTDDSEDFTDKDGNTVNFRKTLYSPLHKGCDCLMTAG